MLSVLPQELIILIMDSVFPHDDQISCDKQLRTTISQCALVHHSWTTHAQQLLFRRVALDIIIPPSQENSGKTPDWHLDISKLVFLNAHSHLCAHVVNIVISEIPQAFKTTHGLPVESLCHWIVRLLPNITRLSLSSSNPFNKTSMRSVFKTLVQAYPYLGSFDVRDCSITLDPETLPEWQWPISMDDTVDVQFVKLSLNFNTLASSLTDILHMFLSTRTRHTLRELVLEDHQFERPGWMRLQGLLPQYDNLRVLHIHVHNIFTRPGLLSGSQGQRMYVTLK
jgi:hypothetical protein